MPTYTYECNKCDLVTDIFHSMNQEITPCVQCGDVMKRIPTAPSFQLKGECWARDGYSKKPPAKKAK
jgi:putative FmdB family regulatory protein